MTTEARIGPSKPRETVQLTLGSADTYEGPRGTPLGAFAAASRPDAELPIVAAIVDGRLTELSQPVTKDCQVQWLDISHPDGIRIYRRSLCFVLIVAARELHPEARIVVDHAVPLGGFYCQVKGHEPFTGDELSAIEQRMREIIERDEPIISERLPLEEARGVFAEQGYDDKVRLLKYRTKEEVPVYRLRGLYDYFYGYMMASTGALHWFHLQPHAPGFILRVPQESAPTLVPPQRDRSQLMRVFREYGHWLEILGMENIPSLNEAVDGDKILEAILVSEALHEADIAGIAQAIMSREPTPRVVLVAGPSSSGKTTFSRRLSIQLKVKGAAPFAIGLDDYFVDRVRTPRDENGEYDFEALEAVDVALFNQHLMSLLQGMPTPLAHYDFATGSSRIGPEVQLADGSIVIVEGIHGLNPQLLTEIPPEWVYRIYVSALTQLNIDDHNRVPTTDSRLLRRMVRDARNRGYDAQATIERWQSVRRGEMRHIFPYQENADSTFNSALAYELAVLRPFAEPLLLRVPPDTPAAIEARRLLAFLEWVRPCDAELVPDNSLLREFIGGSILRHFQF